VAFYSYITSFNISDSSSGSEAIGSFSSSASGYAIDTILPFAGKTESGFTYQPSKTISTFSLTYSADFALSTQKLTVIRNTTSLKNILGSASTQSNVTQQTTTISFDKEFDPYNIIYTYNATQATTCIITTISLSYDPFKTFIGKFTSSSSFTAKAEFSTDPPTTDSSSQSGSYNGDIDNILFLQETYSYTQSFERLSTSEESLTSEIIIGTVNFGSTEYPNAINTFTESTKTCFGVRNQDASFYLAPVNITYYANLEFLRDSNDVHFSSATSPMLRAFFSTKDNILISECDTVLNQSMSTSFSIAGLARSTGTYASSPPQSVTLTTNSIGVTSPTSTTRTIYIYNSLYTGTGQDPVYFLDSYTEDFAGDSFIEVTGTSTYEFGGNLSTAPNSAYSNIQTIIIPTTTSIIDISCNLYSTFSLERSLTINTTTTSLSANLVFVGTSTEQGAGTTYYANPSFYPVSLHMAYSGFLSSSTQEILLGNFIKNVTDKTAYDNVNSDACAGIFRLTAVGSRRGEGDSNYGAKYHSYHNCRKVPLPFDPLTTLIENVTINQNVSSFYGTSSGTSISQTISYMDGTLETSTSRSFEVLYSDSRGTSSWTYDFIVDNDLEYFTWNEQIINILPTPAINPADIFATYGQGKNANYMANGAYFKSDSSSIEFVTTTYSNAISIEQNIAGFTNENYSRITVFTTGHFSNAPLSLNIALRELYAYGEG